MLRFVVRRLFQLVPILFGLGVSFFRWTIIEPPVFVAPPQPVDDNLADVFTAPEAGPVGIDVTEPNRAARGGHRGRRRLTGSENYGTARAQEARRVRR